MSDRPGGADHSRAFDIVFLGVLIAVCAGPYIFGLGFYYDDWVFMARMSQSPDQSFLGILGYFGSWGSIAPRPLQALELVTLHRLFGLNPLPGHLINHLVFWLGAASLYLAIRRLLGSRRIAAYVAVAYVCLPHFMTDRLWYAAYQANLSLLLFATSLYASVRFAEAGRQAGRWWWLGLVAVAMLASGLAYELFLPVFLLVPPVVWCVRLAAEPAGPGGWREHVRPFLLHLVVVGALAAGVIVFKLLADAGQHGFSGGFFRQALGLYWGAFKLSFIDFGVLLPVNIGVMLVQSYRPWALAAALATVIVLGLYLLRLERSAPFETRRYAPVAICAVGLAVLLAGYVVLLHNFNAGFEPPTSIGNRINIASGLGVALLVTGLLLWLRDMVPQRVVGWLVATLLTLACGAGTLVNATVGVFWMEAAAKQEAALALIDRVLPDMPPGGAIALYGLCPSVGPGPVFGSTWSWDLAARLQMRRRDETLRGGLLNRHASLGEGGVYTSEYGEKEFRPYGDLFLIDVRDGSIARLGSEADAKAALASRPLALGAPCVFEDAGDVAIF